MANNTFSKLNAKASKAGVERRSKESRQWFIKNLQGIRDIKRNELLRDDSLITRNKPLIGRMFMFFYDPKTADTLPYYDEFPLIIMVGPAKRGFYGLNLHYLSPRDRAIFFDRLLEHRTNNKYNATTKLRLDYELLSASSKLKQFAPCFKRYLFSNVRSKTVEVPPREWETALFLPSDSFVGEDRTTIWKKSKIL